MRKAKQCMCVSVRMYVCVLLVQILHQYNQSIETKKKGVSVGGSVLPAGRRGGRCSVRRRNGTHLVKRWEHGRLLTG